MYPPEELTDYLDDPEQARWLNHGMTVAEGFCLDHLPAHPRPHQERVAGLLATVAAYLWGSSGGLPSWGSLDVGGLLSFVRGCDLAQQVDDQFFDTLVTFYDYLAILHLVPGPIAERIQRDLFVASHSASAGRSGRFLH